MLSEILKTIASLDDREKFKTSDFDPETLRTIAHDFAVKAIDRAEKIFEEHPIQLLAGGFAAGVLTAFVFADPEKTIQFVKKQGAAYVMDLISRSARS